MDTFSLLLL
ncbi:hypothetical protein GQ607_017931 [Colletotrichum asianum]|uniref:Uncharacterized protein n=1 Tax=Colletotrichum asianum TaxID=702518 RepID=A0A8H3VUW6_9PEZI|nr:hypothetical protein GQ607_017931 [Colletotrichum asianum]